MYTKVNHQSSAKEALGDVHEEEANAGPQKPHQKNEDTTPVRNKE